MDDEGEPALAQYEQEEDREESPPCEILPDFGKIEGETVKLSGLDYALIHQESAKERKHNLLANIKNKLGHFSHRLPLNVQQPSQAKEVDNDSLTKNIEFLSRVKPTINPSTFYLFPVSSFSPQAPDTITRRFGKMHSFPLFIRHEKEDISILKAIIAQEDRAKEDRKKRHLDATKIVPELASEGSDSDE